MAIIGQTTALVVIRTGHTIPLISGITFAFKTAYRVCTFRIGIADIVGAFIDITAIGASSGKPGVALALKATGHIGASRIVMAVVCAIFTLIDFGAFAAGFYGTAVCSLEAFFTLGTRGAEIVPA